MKEIDEIIVHNKCKKSERNIYVHLNTAPPAPIPPDGNVRNNIPAANEHLVITLDRNSGLPGKRYWVTVTAELEMEFIPETLRNVKIRYRKINGKKALCLETPPDYVQWSLKLTLPKTSIVKPIKENVTVGDDDPGIYEGGKKKE